MIAIHFADGKFGRRIEPSIWRAAGDAINSPGGPSDIIDKPTAIAIAPDGAVACIGIKDPDGVIQIGPATGRGRPLIRTSPPNAIAIDPHGRIAYVACEDGTVTPIDLSAEENRTPITVGRGPVAIVLSSSEG